MPITTLFFSFVAILRISKVQLGIVKSIIKSTFLKEFSLFKLGLIPSIFLFIIQVQILPLYFFELRQIHHKWLMHDYSNKKEKL